MSASKITIRPATPDDAEALLSIYAPYVEQTAITFEYEVPSVEEFRDRIVHTLKLLEYFVCKNTFVVAEDRICETHVCAGTCLQGNDECSDHWIKAHDRNHNRSGCQEDPSGCLLLGSQSHTFFLGIHRNSSFQVLCTDK